LQNVRTENAWEDWVIYLLVGVEETSINTIEMIRAINDLMAETKSKLQQDLPKIYSRDLLDIIFLHPYTKIEFLTERLIITRQTAASYLNKICQIGILRKVKKQKYNYYINTKLFELLSK